MTPIHRVGHSPCVWKYRFSSVSPSHCQIHPLSRRPYQASTLLCSSFVRRSKHRGSQHNDWLSYIGRASRGTPGVSLDFSQQVQQNHQTMRSSPLLLITLPGWAWAYLYPMPLSHQRGARSPAAAPAHASRSNLVEKAVSSRPSRTSTHARRCRPLFRLMIVGQSEC